MNETIHGLFNDDGSLRNETERLAYAVGIPAKTLDTHNFATFKTCPENKQAFELCRDYASGKREHFFLTLSGKCGTGKTHLAIATLIYFVMASGRSNARYYQVEGMLDELRSRFENNREGTFDNILNGLKRVDLLVIDDLGAEKSTDWAVAKFDEIIDARYLNEKLTLVTTNLSADELSPRIASRLREGVIAVLKCPDYRQIKARARNANH